MADYVPPTGPPPPKVPEGWKAVWNDQYKEWFYVNTHTKASQWDKPTEPVYASPSGAPPGPPPGYDHGQSKPTGPEKGGFGSNNPYNGSAPGQSSISEDERLARQLQAEEEAKARSSGGNANRGAADSYYQGPQGQGSYPQQYGQQQGPGSPYGQQQPPGSSDGSKKGGFFSKFTNKLGGGSSQRPPQQGGYPGATGQYGSGYGQYQSPPPQQQYYGGPPPGQYYGGAPPAQYQQQPQKKHGIGAGGALLGAGAGLVGGALLMDAFEDHEQHEEQQAYDQGYDQGYDNGGGGDDYGMDDGGDF